MIVGDCIVTGWGKRREGGKNSNILQKVWLPLMSDTVCKDKMKKIGYDVLVSDTMICAGYNAGGKDACQGDSGGPLVCPGKGDLPILVGIVSWGIGCARKDIPGVYTEVSHYINWINKKIKENSPITINRGPFPDRFKWWNFQLHRNKPLNTYIEMSDIIPIIYPIHQNTGKVEQIRAKIWDSEESSEENSSQEI
ncbi:Plasma kallikrein [Armadillidium vulgare]|nr:Plasma kallikrein [Armadillidium vulgare]